MVSKQLSQRDYLVCARAGRSMYSRDSISRPRPTTMLFYVRHRTDGRKKISLTFMTYSLFPWRRRLFLLSANIGD